MVDLGVRGGAELRKMVKAAKDAKRARYQCPVCGKKKVKREGFARWGCRACGTVFAGGVN